MSERLDDRLVIRSLPIEDGHPLDATDQAGKDHVFLGGEVAVEGSGGHLGRSRDVGDGHPSMAVFGEQAEGDPLHLHEFRDRRRVRRSIGRRVSSSQLVVRCSSAPWGRPPPMGDIQVVANLPS
jgi:hypothetical protein